MNRIIYAGKHLITFSVTRHVHTSWELIYCTSGSGVIRTDSTTLPYETSDIIVMPPGIPHLNLSREGFTNIHINMTDPAFQLNRPAVVRSDSEGFLLNAFSAAFFHFSKPEHSLPFLSSYGDLISYYIAAHLDAPEHSGVVEEIINCIVRNYPDCDFELDEYLHSLPFSYDYLRRLFKKETGMTPHQFLSGKRLEIAASCLSSDLTGRSVTEIAHLCGYREPLYFSRVFKKAYGVSPSGYQAHITSQMRTDINSDSMKILLD